MLWVIVCLLLLLWVLGTGLSLASSGLIHLLLVIALIVVVIQLLNGRRML